MNNRDENCSIAISSLFETRCTLQIFSNHNTAVFSLTCYHLNTHTLTLLTALLIRSKRLNLKSQPEHLEKCKWYHYTQKAILTKMHFSEFLQNLQILHLKPALSPQKPIGFFPPKLPLPNRCMAISNYHHSP